MSNSVRKFSELQKNVRVFTSCKLYVLTRFAVVERIKQLTSFFQLFTFQKNAQYQASWTWTCFHYFDNCSSANALVSVSGRSEVQVSGRSNRAQCCLQLANGTTFLQRELCCPGAMMRSWAHTLVTRFGVKRRVCL